MKEVEKDVKHQGETVAQIIIPTYETIEEAQAVFSPEALLQLINSQNQANLMNAKRAEFRPSKSGKKALFAEAYAYCFKTCPDELSNAIGDFEGLKAFVESKIEEMQAAKE